jgi:hypothetical protein
MIFVFFLYPFKHDIWFRGGILYEREGESAYIYMVYCLSRGEAIEELERN